MNYFLACLFSLLMPIFSYYFYKMYQMSGYTVQGFFDILLSQGLPFGNKNKLVFTKRMLRAILMHFVLCSVIIFFIFVYVGNAGLVFLYILLIYLFSPILLLFAHFVLLPIEILIKKHYINKAKLKLASKSVKIIGITGSFGKTSTKNILAHILEKNFKVCKTPLNYNTEMGLTKTILQNLDDEEILIAEMGARHRGDIKSLCQIARPDISVVTTVGPQHLQTFGSIENIEHTKAEIIEYSKGDAPIFVNCDSHSSNNIFKQCNKKKFACNKYGGYAYASDVNFDASGTSFILHLDDKSFKVSCKLLGRHNVDNIVTASAVAYYLGIDEKDISDAINSLSPTPHRLELIRNGNVCVLDDAYNSNPIGASEALNVLAKFNGRKIVVTPGFVEMGQESVNANFKLGAMIADSADFVVIMNELNKNYILSGLISHNFNKNHIFFASNRQKQAEILKSLICENAVVLFENDLPDSYR